MSGLLPPVVARILADASEFNGSLAKAGEEMGAFGREVEKVNLQMRQSSLAASEAATRAAEAQSRAAESALKASQAQERATALAREAAGAQEQAGRAAEQAALGLGSEADAQRLLTEAQTKATAAAAAQAEAQRMAARSAADATAAEYALERASIAEARATEASTVAARTGSAEHKSLGAAAEFGRKSLLGTAAAATLVGFESLKMAGDFQQSTNVFRTAAHETAAGLVVVRQGILDIASQTGTSWQNLTDGMYVLEKAGYDAAHGGLDVLRASAQGAREENAHLATVVDAMTSVMQSYHLHAEDSVRVMNALKTGAGQAKTTMEEFAGSLSTVIPIAYVNKISIADVFGALGTLTQHGTTAKEATLELAATIKALAAPNRVATAELQNLGFSAQDLQMHLAQRGLAGTIDLLSTTILTKMGPSGMVLLKTFNQSKSAAADALIMLNAMPASLQTLAKEYAAGTISLGDWRKSLKALPVDQAALATQFGTLENKAKGFNAALRMGDPASQTFTEALKKSLNGTIGMNTALQLGGESMAGYQARLEAVSKSYNDGSKNVEGWDITQKNFNVTMGSAKQAIEAVAIKLGTALMPAVQTSVGWIRQHTDVAAAFAAVIGGVVVTAIGIYIAQLTIATVKTVASAAATLASWTALAAGSAVMGARIAAVYAAQAARAAIATAVQVAGFVAVAAAATAAFVAENIATLGIIAGIALLIAAAVYLATHWSQSWNAIKTAVSVAWDWIHQHIVLILTIALGPLGLAIGELVTHWSQAWDGIKSAVSAAWDFIKPIFDRIISAAAAVGNAVSKVTGVAGKIGSTVGSIATGHIPGFADGGWVPGPAGQAQLAVVHGGEFVLSADMLRGAKSVGAGAVSGSSSVPALPSPAGQGSARGGSITVEKGAFQVVVQGDVTRENVDRVNAAVDRALHKLIVQIQAGVR